MLGGSPGSRWPAGPVFDEGFLAAVFLILVTPEIVDAIGLQIWFVNLGGLFRQGLFPLWIGQSIFSSAVVTLIVRPAWPGSMNARRGRSRPLRDACTRLPPDHPAAGLPRPAGGGLLAFTFSLDNVIISQFVSVPGSTTFPSTCSHPRQVIRPDIGAASASCSDRRCSPSVWSSRAQAFGGLSTEIAATITGGWLTPQPPAYPG